MKFLAALVFAVAGFGLLSVNTANNLVEINRTEFALDTSAVILGLAVMSALLSLFIVPVWKLSRPTAVVAVFIVVGCMVTSVRLTTDRIGDIEDSAKQSSRNINGRIARTDQIVARLTKKIDAQRIVTALECRGYREGISKTARWPKCLTARSLIVDYETELDEAQAERRTVGEKVLETRHSERFLAWIAGARAGNAATMIQPVLIATLLEVGTALLMSIAGLFASAARRNNVIDMERIDPVVVALRHGPLSNRELARCLGWSESRASRTVRKLVSEGELRSVRDGQRKMIELTAP